MIAETFVLSIDMGAKKAAVQSEKRLPHVDRDEPGHAFETRATAGRKWLAKKGAGRRGYADAAAGSGGNGRD